MTLPSSKKHQTTRANTRRWSRLKLAVLGASVLWNMAPLASADQPAGLRTRDTSASQPAAARWKKLKGQYEVSPSASTRSTQLEQSNGKGNAVQATPVSTNAEPRAAELESTSPAYEQTPDRAALPLPDTEPAAAPVDDLSDPFGEQVAGERPESTQNVTQLDPKTQEKRQIQTPMDPVGAPRAIQRPTAQIQGGPPRKTTQVRRISDINPQNDFDRDTEIKQYAAERAREFNVRFGGDTYTPRNFPDMGVCWTPPTTKYYPLYFEDPALERYGHTHHHLIQPIISSARMSAQLVMMPYQMTMVPPWELHSPLGWYRPGDVVPKLRYPFPWNTKAALVEAAAVTGFIYVIP